LNFELKILGSNSAAPAHNRHQTAQLLSIYNQLYMIDCGEGTQMQLTRYKVKFHRINHIFISHLHGDHYIGLIGLISTMHLQKRESDLTIYGPPGLSDILTLQLKYSQTILSYKINFKEYDPSSRQIVLDDEHVTVETIPLKHRVACSGFLIREKPNKRRLNKLKNLEQFNLQQLLDLKDGKDILDEEGSILYQNEDFTLPPKKARSYAYCSDTLYDEGIIGQIQNVDLLYHEATFLSDREERAKETFHSTARQAATIAKKADVGQLVIGHFSIRYKDLNPLLQEARETFKNTVLAIEGETIAVEFVSLF
jgi:ribonuclease Z